MAVVWAHCKSKTVCEPDEVKDEGADPESDESKKGHGGCGHIQPQIRKEGLKLFVQYKKTKDDDDVGFSVCCHGCPAYAIWGRRSNPCNRISESSPRPRSTLSSRR